MLALDEPVRDITNSRMYVSHFCKLLPLSRVVPKLVTIHNLYPDLYKDQQ